MKPLYSCTGGPAEGEKHFFERSGITKRIRRKLRNREHLLIAAPRRIGKTSILKYIRDTPENNQIVIYLIVQSVESIDEFNKKLFTTLIKNQHVYNIVSGYIKRASTTLKRIIGGIKGVKVDGVDLSGEDSIDYYDELNNLFDELKSHAKQIVIFVDEFPDAITNINETDHRNAIKLLQQQRELRIEYKNSQIQFIYTGSTGLINVVKKLGKVDLVNDLSIIKVPPLSQSEAKELMTRLVLGKQTELDSFKISCEVIDYTLEKMHWLLPYFIQIIIDGLFDEHEQYEPNSAPAITNETIDDFFDLLVKTHSTHSGYFDHWETRLKYIGKEDHQLAIETLNLTARQGEISYDEFHDLATKLEIKDPKYILDVLQYDGYLAESADGNRYGFNSVLLKEWWANNVAR